jgi:hypothetical protein
MLAIGSLSNRKQPRQQVRLPLADCPAPLRLVTLPTAQHRIRRSIAASTAARCRVIQNARVRASQRPPAVGTVRVLGPQFKAEHPPHRAPAAEPSLHAAGRVNLGVEDRQGVDHAGTPFPASSFIPSCRTASISPRSSSRSAFKTSSRVARFTLGSRIASGNSRCGMADCSTS